MQRETNAIGEILRVKFELCATLNNQSINRVLMEAIDVRDLREWSPLTDVFAKLPLKVQKGFFSVELNVTCVDALDEYLAIGTDAGIVYWYNRRNGNVQNLRTEVSSSILFYANGSGSDSSISILLSLFSLWLNSQ